MNWTRYYDEHFPGGIEVIGRLPLAQPPVQTLAADAAFQAWCRECPEEWVEWQRAWAEELMRC